MDLNKIESIIRENGYEDFRWISGEDVVVCQWPRFKCMFGCSTYGKKGTCPPSVPSIEDCREFFNEFLEIIVERRAFQVFNIDQCILGIKAIL